MTTYLQNLYRYKDLFVELVKKDVKIKYKDSLLGLFWSMLNPVLMMIVLCVVFMALFKSQVPNFPVYVLIGRIIYQFYSEATNFAMDSIYANGQLIKKVYVPKYFFPLSRVCSSFITTMVGLIPLVILMAMTGMTFHWVNLLFVIPLFYLLVISAGIGLLLSALNVFFRDLKHLYSVMLLIIMYMTPIFYPASIIPERYAPLFILNPLFTIVEMFRDIVMYGVMPSATDHLILIAYMVVYPVVGLCVFYKTQDKFIYHL